MAWGGTTAAGSPNAQPRDEEARRVVHVRQREQELRPPRMPELRPLVAERHGLQPGCVDDVLVLFGVDRAHGVEDRSARLDAVGGDAQELLLELRERARAPAQ